MSAREIADRFSKFFSHSSGNNDSDAVHWAWQQVLKRRESRKILIVLSDGAPTDSWKGHAHKNLKFVTNAIEKDGRVELYGVGIMSEAVRHYYTNYKVLYSPEEINNTLFNVIKEGDNVKRRQIH
jgi:cobalamin biosynthesis protein CobT